MGREEGGRRVELVAAGVLLRSPIMLLADMVEGSVTYTRCMESLGRGGVIGKEDGWAEGERGR